MRVSRAAFRALLAASVRRGWWFATIVTASYVVLFLQTLTSFPYASPFGTVDEQLNYYQAARNFVRYGFLPTRGLQDLASSPRPEHHPFVYNHMPPGPEIATALMMTVVGERYALIRLGFAVTFVAGLFVFLRFVRLVIGQLALTGEGYALAFLKPALVMHTIDHPAYSAFPLLAFLPILLVQRHYRSGGRRWLALALGLTFVASCYLVYQNLLMLVVTWVVLALWPVIRLERKHALALVAAAVAGIVAHALQTVLLLGPGVFVRETVLALSNRMFGVPSYEELKQLYASLDLVHHGTHHFDAFRLGRAVAGGLRIFGSGCTTALVLLVLGMEMRRHPRTGAPLSRSVGTVEPSTRRVVKFFGALGLWLVLAISVPLLLFPAYSADYGVAGMNEYFLATAGVAAYAWIIATFARWRSSGFRRIARGAPRVWVAAGVVALAGMLALAGLQVRGAVEVVRVALQPNPDRALLDIAAHLKGKVTMTNVYPTSVGFFTEDVVFGGCEERAFLPDGSVDPNECHTGFFRGFGRAPEVRPTHYVLFRSLFTGFTMCLNRCLDELERFVAARHRVVLRSERFTVFELTGPVVPGARSRALTTLAPTVARGGESPVGDADQAAERLTGGGGR